MIGGYDNDDNLDDNNDNDNLNDNNDNDDNDVDDADDDVYDYDNDAVRQGHATLRYKMLISISRIMTNSENQITHQKKACEKNPQNERLLLIYPVMSSFVFLC